MRSQGRGRGVRPAARSGRAVWRVWGTLKTLAFRLQVPEDFAERLYLEQARDFSRIIIAISLLGLATICLLFLEFRFVRQAMLHGAVMLAVALCYFALIARARTGCFTKIPPGRMPTFI